MKENVIILGSTGSIGANTLEVLSIHSESFKVFAIAANSSVDILFEQCKKFNGGCLVKSINSTPELIRSGQPKQYDIGIFISFLLACIIIEPSL